MPQLGSSDKDVRKKNGEPEKSHSFHLFKKKDDDEEEEEVVSAYSPEGEKRRAEAEASYKKKGKIAYFTMGGLLVAVLIVFLVGALTNWFRG